MAGIVALADFEPLARLAMDPARLRLRRRRRLGRDHPRRERGGLAPPPAAPARARRREPGRRGDDAARPAGDDARRDRPDGRPGPGPPRRRGRHGPGRGRRRRAVHPLDDVVLLDRGRRGARPPTASAGSSSTPRRTPAAPANWSSARRPPAIAAIVLTVDLPVLGLPRARPPVRLRPAGPLGNFAEPTAGRRTAAASTPTDSTALEQVSSPV